MIIVACQCISIVIRCSGAASCSDLVCLSSRSLKIRSVYVACLLIFISGHLLRNLCENSFEIVLFNCFVFPGLCPGMSRMIAIVALTPLIIHFMRLRFRMRWLELGTSFSRFFRLAHVFFNQLTSVVHSGETLCVSSLLANDVLGDLRGSVILDAACVDHSDLVLSGVDVVKVLHF